GRWMDKYESAGRHGAGAVIIIHTTPCAGYPWHTVQASWGGAQFNVPADGEPHAQIEAWITEAAARRLLGPGGSLDTLVEPAKRRDFKPVSLGMTTAIALG